MVLGHSLTDARGVEHAMAGLLPLKTSFARPALHLGYRETVLTSPCFLGAAGSRLRGHEFHFATVTAEAAGTLFNTWDATGRERGPTGSRVGSVMGSFVHLIDRV